MDDFDARRASLDLVTAFVNNNALSADQLPALLRDVFAAISNFKTEPSSAPLPLKEEPAGDATKVVSFAETSAERTARQEDQAPPISVKARTPGELAVTVRESLADPAVIVSLITGERFKTLKRHLTKHGLTAAEYKAQFSLPDDYPMVAPAYAELRRKIAVARTAKGKRAEPAAALLATAEPRAQQPAPKLSNAEARSRRAKNKSRPDAAPKQTMRSGGRQLSGASVALRVPSDVVSDAAGHLAFDPAEAHARSTSVAPPRGPRTEQLAGKAPPAKSPRKRRMARPTVGDVSSQAVASIAPFVSEGSASGKDVPALNVITANVSMAGGAPVVGDELIQPKSVRKGRKKLSVKFS